MKKYNDNYEILNKKNQKLTKGLVLTLAGITTIGLGAFISSQSEEAKAMIGRIVSSAARTSSRNPVTPKTPVTVPKYVSTSRILTGGGTSSKTPNNGTQFQGLKLNAFAPPRNDIIIPSPSKTTTTPTTPSTPTTPTSKPPYALSKSGSSFQGLPKTSDGADKKFPTLKQTFYKRFNKD